MSESCRFQRPILKRRASQIASQITPQIASVTTIGAKKTIPTEFKELQEELSNLRKVGANYTNLSQLQLALRGLESRDSIIRIGGTLT